jgi:hypothetical protein
MLWWRWPNLNFMGWLSCIGYFLYGVFVCSGLLVWRFSFIDFFCMAIFLLWRFPCIATILFELAVDSVLRGSRTSYNINNRPNPNLPYATLLTLSITLSARSAFLLLLQLMKIYKPASRCYKVELYASQHLEWCRWLIRTNVRVFLEIQYSCLCMGIRQEMHWLQDSAHPSKWS